MKELIEALKELADNLITANGTEDCPEDFKEYSEAYEKASQDAGNQILEVLKKFEGIQANEGAYVSGHPGPYKPIIGEDGSYYAGPENHDRNS